MGNYVSRLLEKSNGDGGLGVYRGWVAEGSREVGDLTVATKVEAQKSSVSRRGTDDAGMASLEALVPPEKRQPYYKEALERTRRRDRRLEEIGFDVRLQEGKLAKLRKAPADRPKEVAISISWSRLRKKFTGLAYMHIKMDNALAFLWAFSRIVNYDLWN